MPGKYSGSAADAIANEAKKGKKKKYKQMKKKNVGKTLTQAEMQRQKKKYGTVLVFDSAARSDFITGFHKRKLARKKEGARIKVEQARKDRIKLRKEQREAQVQAAKDTLVKIPELKQDREEKEQDDQDYLNRGGNANNYVEVPNAFLQMANGQRDSAQYEDIDSVVTVVTSTLSTQDSEDDNDNYDLVSREGVANDEKARASKQQHSDGLAAAIAKIKADNIAKNEKAREANLKHARAQMQQRKKRKKRRKKDDKPAKRRK